MNTIIKDFQDQKRESEKEEFTYKVRDTVLKALDGLAPNGKGWTDQDLPQLFKALDKHAETLFERLQR
jgi:hypothetical protein